MFEPASVADLRERLKAGTVVPVIGAGVSRQTAGMPTWWGLIEAASHHAVMVGCASEADQAAVKALLDQGAFVLAAQKVKSLLGTPQGEYPYWLQQTCRTKSDANLSTTLLVPLYSNNPDRRILSSLAIPSLREGYLNSSHIRPSSAEIL